jgi:hypothetical protein
VAYNDEVSFSGRLSRHYRLLAAGVVSPPAACLILLPLRNRIPNTSAALLLVLVVVAIASPGDRLAGLLGAVSAALAFEFFLTQPYERFTIASATDLQTTLLLLGVGLVITEIAYRGKRQQAMASARLGYLEGVETLAKIAADGSSSPSALIERVGEQIAQVLGLAGCRFDYGMGLGFPRLESDGRMHWRNEIWDPDTQGLPADHETELVVESGGAFMGRFLLKAYSPVIWGGSLVLQGREETLPSRVVSGLRCSP